MPLGLLLAVMLAGATSVGVEFRLLDGGESFRQLDRTSLLYGSVEFRLRTADGIVSAGLRVLDDSVTPSGEPTPLCEGAPGSPCIAQFSSIARYRLRFEVGDRILGPVTTFHAASNDPARDVQWNTRVDRASARATPPDQVTRTIRFESVGGGRDDVGYETDIKKEEIEVKVGGVRGVKVTALIPPDPETPKLIPILFDVAPYIRPTEQRDRREWNDAYAVRVAELLRALRRAASSGVDVEYLVVAYGAGGRLFGPFRLHLGELDERRLAANDATLAALERVLLPAPEPDVAAGGFGAVVHTLNDLYLRSFEGQVQLVWITDGWSAGGVPRFQPDLWPARIAELNVPWSDEEQAAILAALDSGRGLDDAELSRFIVSIPPDEADRAARILRFLRSLDRDATRTLHPHRVDTSPMMNCLFIPSSRSLRGDRLFEFMGFVELDWGGDFFRLLRLKMSMTEALEEELTQRGQRSRVESLEGLLELTYEQLLHSGRIVLEVPNPKQDGAQREIKVKVRRDTVRARLMPTYHSSRPLVRRLPDFLGSPFKSLRLLAAYEVRYHPFDRRLQEALKQRWQVETDPQVREVVFESWVSVQLQLLQADDDPREAHEALVSAAREADRLPKPDLARDAAAAAEWFVSRRSP